jgi:hypothetical protein
MQPFFWENLEGVYGLDLEGRTWIWIWIWIGIWQICLLSLLGGL